MGKRTNYPILQEGQPRFTQVGKKLKEDLKESGISYAELSRLSGVDAQLIGRLCRKPGTVPDLRALAAIAKARKRSVDWYLWDQPPELAVMCEFFNYTWMKMLHSEKELVLKSVRYAEDMANARLTLEKYGGEKTESVV